MPPVNLCTFGGMRPGFNSLFTPNQSTRFQPVTDNDEPACSTSTNLFPGVESFDGFPQRLNTMFPSGNGHDADIENNGRGRKLSDWTVTTAPNSRPESEEMGLASTEGGLNRGVNQTCSCHVNRQTSTENPTPQRLANHTLQPGHQYPNRLSVNDVLNDSPNIPPLSSQNHLAWTSVSISNTNIRPPTPPASPTLTNSITSTPSTVVPPLNITEQRYCLLNTLYHTCLDTSASYIRSLIPASRARRQNAREQRRSHPYSRSSISQPATQQPNLMDDISKICTHIWRKARGDIMAPHRAEAEAVKVMRDLYAWGETVVRGVDGNGAGEEESDAGSLWEDLRGAGIDQSEKYGEAAKRFCEWLDDAEAWRACQEIFMELKLLDDRERDHSDCSSDIE